MKSFDFFKDIAIRLFFPLLFLCEKSLQVCIGDITKGTCVECSSNFYLDPTLLHVDYINSSNCFQKNSVNTNYAQNYYISNISCSNANQCTGNKTFPFDSLFKALNQIHVIDLASKYQSQDIKLYLLGSPHYILNSDINFYGTRFFRRMNSSVIISPWFCEDEVITGCVYKSQGQRIDLIIKTFGFNFEIYRNFTLENLNFIANDLILQNITSKSCYNTKSICCNDTLLNQLSNQDECGLNNFSLNLLPKTQLPKLKSFLQIRLLYNEDMTQNASILETPIPTLNLINVSMSYFYSIYSSNDTWMSLISFGTLGYSLNIINVDFKKTFFQFGIFYFSIIEQDPYYQYLADSSLNALYLKYPSSNLYSSSIRINGLIITEYFGHSILASGNLAPGIINLYDQRIVSMNYEFNNTSVQNNNVSYPLYFFSFMPSSGYQPTFSFQNFLFQNATSLLLIQSASCNFSFNQIIVQNVSMMNNNQNIFIFLGQGNLSFLIFNNSQFLLLSLNYNFMNATDYGLEFSNITFSFIQNFFSFFLTRGHLYLMHWNLFQINLQNNIIFSTSQTNISLVDTKIINNNQGTSSPLQSLFVFYCLSGNFLFFNSLNLLIDNFNFTGSGVSFFFIQDTLNTVWLSTNISFINSEIKNVRSNIPLNSAARNYLLNFRYVFADQLYLQNFTICNYELLVLLMLSQGTPNVFIYDFLIENSTLNYRIVWLNMFDYVMRWNTLNMSNVVIRNLYYPLLTYWLIFFNCIQNTLDNVTIINITHVDYYTNHFLSNGQSEQYMIYDQNSFALVINNSYLESSVECNYNVLIFHNIKDVIISNVKFVSIPNPKLPKLIKAIWLLLYGGGAINGTMLNCSFYNFEYFKNVYIDTQCQFGVVFAYSNYGANFTAKNIVFYNNTADYYGLLTLAFIQVVDLYNLTFINSTSKEGGAFTVYSTYTSGSKTLIEKIKILNTKSTSGNGGGIYFRKVQNLVMKNVFISNTQANYGGAISFNNISKALVQNVTIKNTNGIYGGAFYIFQAVLLNFSNIEINNSQGSYGGSIYSDSSSIILNYTSINNTQANFSGGALYLISVQDSNVVIFIYKSVISFCYAETAGSCLSVSQLQNLKIYDTQFGLSWAKPEKNVGIIQVSTYFQFINKSLYNSSQNIFENVVCLNTMAQVSCFYLSSNLKLSIINCFTFNGSGSVLFLESDGFANDWQTINLFNFTSSFSNSFENQMRRNATNSLFTINNANKVNIENFAVYDNFHISYLFSIKYSQVSIKNSSFWDYISIANTFAYMYLLSSQVTMFHITISYSKDFKNLKSPILNIVDSSLTVNESIFSNVITNSFSVFYLQTTQSNSIFIFLKVSFVELGAVKSVIYADTTSLLLINCSFESNIQIGNATNKDDNAIDLYFFDDRNQNNLSIYSSRFENKGGACSISIIGGLFIYIFSSEFISTKTEEISNFALYMDSVYNVTLVLTNFISFESKLGGSLLIYKRNLKDPLMTVLIQNCSFENNTAYLGGAIFMRGQILLSIFSSFFISNIAKISVSSSYIGESGKGGCLVSDSEYYPMSQVILKNSSFINNYAENFAPTFLVKNINIADLLSPNIFINNSDKINFSDSVTSLPIQYFILDSDFEFGNPDVHHQLINNSEKSINLINKYGREKFLAASGQPFNFSIMMTDYYNQTLYFESGIYAKMQCSLSSNSNDSTVLLTKESSTVSKGIFSFINFTVTTPPPGDLNCLISIFSDETILIASTLDPIITSTLDRTDQKSLSIEIRTCIKGEVLMLDNTCRVCSPNTFSLTDPMNKNISTTCMPCPANAFCPGGSFLQPLKGNWRYSENSSLVISCPTPQSCLGYDSSNYSIQGKCENGYWGNLCYTCELGLGRSQENGICEACTQMTWVYLKIVIGFIFIVSYTYIQASIYSKMNNMETALAVLLKQFINHFQILAMISLVNFNWSREFQVYFSVQEYFSCLYQDFFNIDCLIQSINENLLVQKIVFEILLPILFSMIILLIWIFVFAYNLHKKTEKIARKNFLSNKIRTTFIVLIFIFYPEILRKCFILLNCILLDNSDNFSVLSYSPQVTCWESDHLLWVLVVSLPGIIIWGILTPLLIAFILYRNNEEIKEIMKIYVQKTEAKILRDSIKCSIVITVEHSIKEKIFPDTDFPIFDSIIYKFKQLKIAENIEINVKSREEIEREFTEDPEKMAANLLDSIKKMNVSQEDFKNQKSLIKEPIDFYDIMKMHPAIRVGSDLEKDHLVSNYIFFRKKFDLMMESEQFPKNKKRETILKRNTFSLNKTLDDSQLSNSVFKNLAFIFKGYKENYYFWEIVLFSRKFFLLFVAVVSEIFPGETQNTNILLILFFYYDIQNRCQPYAFNYFNHIEATTMKISLITVLIGIFLSEELFKPASLYLLIFIFLINVYFLGLWCYYVNKHGNLKNKFKNLLGKIRRL